MGAGLKVLGDQFNVQIDGSTPHVTLLRKGSVQSGVATTYTQTNSSLAYITVEPGEVLAFRPQQGQWAAVWGRNGNTVTLVCTGANTVIEYWIFSKHQASGVNYGMRLFDEATGQLIYDTGRPVMNILGSHDGTGGPSSWAAAGVAVIPWQQYAGIDRQIVYTNVGPKPDFMAFIFAISGTAAVSGNQVSTSNRTLFANATGPYDQTGVFPSDWVYTGNNGLDNRYLVISTDNL